MMNNPKFCISRYLTMRLIAKNMANAKLVASIIFSREKQRVIPDYIFCCKIRDNKGVVLPITLTFVLAFTMLGFGTIYMATRQNEAAEHQIFSEKAFWLAEAGIQQALWEVEHNECSSFVSKSTGQTCNAGCTACGEKVFVNVSKRDVTNPPSHLLEGHYDLKLTSANSSATVTGSYPSRSKDINRRQRTVRFASNSPFNYAIFSDEKIKLFQKVTIDSYNSSLGEYGKDLGDNKKNIFENGDVGTNISATSNKDEAAAISLQGYGQSPFDVFKGDVSMGPGGKIVWPGLKDDEIAQSVTGEIKNDSNFELPPVVVPTNLSGLTSKGDLDLSKKNTHTLSEGSYKYSSIGMMDESKLIINGNVKIYLTKKGITALKVWDDSEVIINPKSSLTLYTDGEITMHRRSRIRNSDKDPKKLTIYSTYSSDANGMNIWSGNVDPKDKIDRNFYGTIYAPETRISVHNYDDKGELFGSFIGKDFYLDEGKIHYDEALAEEITNPDTSWHEISESIVP